MSNLSKQSKTLSPEGKKALFGAYTGFSIDMFDVYLPIVALGPAMVYFQPSNMSPSLATTLYYMIFFLSMLGRPIGSFIFGNIADRVGRKRTNQISLLGLSISTLIIAMLPGYSSWGLGAIVILSILRFISGVFMGGEYTAANPLAMEYSPQNKRGLLGGLINAGAPTGLLLISIMTSILLSNMPSGSPESFYSVWGWRIPFVFGALFSFFLFIYYTRKVEESKVWEATSDKKDTSSPLKELFRGENLKQLSQVFLLMNGIWFIMNGVVTELPATLKLIGVNSLDISNVQLIANIFCIPAYPLAGLLSQKIGRKPALRLFGILCFTITPVLYYWLINSGFQNKSSLYILVILINLFGQSIFGILTAYITERFQTGIRASGYGIGYSLAVIIPSFSPFFMLAFKSFMPYEYTPLMILGIGGIITTIASLFGPETKDVVFGKAGKNDTESPTETGNFSMTQTETLFE